MTEANDSRQPEDGKTPDSGRSIGKVSFRIERRIDIAAIAAFLLSLIVASWEVAMYVRGPQVKVIPSGVVTLFGNFCEKSNQFLEVIMPMAFVNTARVGQTDVVLEEKIHLKFPRRWDIDTVQLHAGKIVKETDNTLRASPKFCEERTSQKQYPGVTLEDGEGQLVAPIQGGLALARTIHYFVDSRICDADWQGCVEQSTGVEMDKIWEKAQEGDKLEVEFHVKLLVGGNKVDRCAVELSDEMIQHFKNTYNLATDCRSLK